MFVTRTPPASLGARLDSSFYDPIYFSDQERFAAFPQQTLESMRERTAKICYGVIKPVFTDSDCGMVQIQDFEEPFADIHDAPTIDPRRDAGFSRSHCRTGDLLVAVGGYPGRLGVLGQIPSHLKSVNINRHVVRVRFAEGPTTAYFVAALLLTQYGRRLLARQISGSVQAGINVEDFREIAVPRFDSASEEYIAAKARHAERLRDGARKLQGGAATHFGGLHSFSGARKLGTWRLNSSSI